MRARLIDAGLERHSETLMGLVRSSIRLHSVPLGPGPLGVGATRLGGEPDLPETTAWPSLHDRPLSFIAQINLGEIARLDADGTLPEAGLLSFFYDAERTPWGFDPADSGSWAVLYTPPDHRLVQRQADDHRRQLRFKPCVLRGAVELTYAPWASAEVEALGLSREEMATYGEVIEQAVSTGHRMLGHPDPVQGDMQLECQLVVNGLYCGDDTGYEDPRAAALIPGAVDWRLLLQIDSDEHAGMMWGDMGRIYYWIRKQDLAARAWDAAWVILQCF